MHSGQKVEGAGKANVIGRKAIRKRARVGEKKCCMRKGSRKRGLH